LDEALVLSRLLHFTATFLLLGISAFLWKIVPAEISGRLETQLRPLLRLCLVLAGVTALTWLVLVACSFGDGCAELVHGDMLPTVLFDTAFGNAWLVRLGLIALLNVSVVLSRNYRSREVVVASGLVVASLGLVGHAAMGSGVAAVLREFNHAAHLTTAALWIGGLVPLALVLSQCRPSGDNGAVLGALRRFSGMGHVVVALVIATGAINTWFIVGGWWLNIGSYYQTMLLAKIGLVIAMTIMAIVNRYVLLPRFERNNPVFRLLYCNTLLEVFLGFMAIGLVSYFATLDPV
jgi:putative copper resistance protein D